MKAQIKAKTKPRNQPVQFGETLNSTLPSAVIPVTGTRVSLEKARLGLGIIWVAAAVSAGIGFGLLIRTHSSGNSVAVYPAPVATLQLSVQSASAKVLTSGPVVLAPSVAYAPLAVRFASSYLQAQSGSTLSTISAGLSQGALGTVALQPGFVQAPLPQGNIATSPVR